MPLRDHFHPPLSEHRHWESFHARWASAIADTLDGGVLPKGYFAEVHVHLGSQLEIDVAAFGEDVSRSNLSPGTGAATALATPAAAVWSPPAADMILPAIFPDRVEVLVYSDEAGPTLVAAIELVSPRNKDRPQSRRAFAAKCAAYLQQGIGLVVIDIVTNRHANLHNALIEVLELTDETYKLQPQVLYAIAYRPVSMPSGAQMEIWHRELAVGRVFPTLPLPLDKGRCVRFDIEETYAEACDRTRLPAS